MKNHQIKKIDSNGLLLTIIYAICVSLSILNSYAIFTEFLHNHTIISTRVTTPSNGLLDIPYILVCNDSAFKEPVMNTEYHGFVQNTLDLDEVFVDLKIFQNAGHGILDVKSESMKNSLKKIFTAFHGTCFLINKKLQVWNLFQC